MVSQVLLIRIGAVSQPCMGREGWRRWLAICILLHNTQCLFSYKETEYTSIKVDASIQNYDSDNKQM